MLTLNIFHRIALSAVLVLGAAPAPSQAADPPLAESADSDITKTEKIGRTHDQLRRASAWHDLAAEGSDLYGRYSRFKARTREDLGLSWAIDTSYIEQWGQPDGGSPAGQFSLDASADWVLFKNQSLGEGSVQFAYTVVRYPTDQDGNDVTQRLGLNTPINDYPSYQNTFNRLTYTQALPGDRLLISAGQYPFAEFDGNEYMNSQHRNFNNYILAQNGSQTYPNAGLGAFAQINATRTIHFAIGFQNAANISGATLSTDRFGEDGFAWFGYAQWTPHPVGLGPARYSVLYYQVPTVPQQTRSAGWSLNAVQHLDDTWAVFGRANRADDYVNPIQSSYAIGITMNDPINRRPTDQIGLAFGHSDAAPPPTNPDGARSEKIIETYWNWTFYGGLLLTPHVQYVRDPALDPTIDNVWVLSLRATLML